MYCSPEPVRLRSVGRLRCRDRSGPPRQPRQQPKPLQRDAHLRKEHPGCDRTITSACPTTGRTTPNDPIYLDGEYHYYYLYNADYLNGGGGTSWRRATTTDHVMFRDRGVAIKKFTNNKGDCWSGCLVADERNTAGYGAGAVIALVTQAPEGRQAQYLWYSTDGGAVVSARRPCPGATKPGGE